MLTFRVVVLDVEVAFVSHQITGLLCCLYIVWTPFSSELAFRSEFYLNLFDIVLEQTFICDFEFRPYSYVIARYARERVLKSMVWAPSFFKLFFRSGFYSDPFNTRY